MSGDCSPPAVNADRARTPQRNLDLTALGGAMQNITSAQR